MARKTKEASTETRSRILEQATVLFTKQGYNATTIAEIALQIGLTKGAIFHHFETKKTLFTAIWVDLQNELHEHLYATAAKVAKVSNDPFKGMLASARVHIDQIQHDKRFKNIVMIDGPKVLGMDEWIERDAAFGLARIKDGLRYLVYKSVLPDTEDMDYLAKLLLGTISYAALAVRDKADGDALIAKFEQLIRGLDTRPEK